MARRRLFRPIRRRCPVPPRRPSLVTHLEAGPPLYQVETNIDDQNPELLPPLLEKLLQGGARDAWLIPIIMKKGRPAVTLAFLAPADRLDGLMTLAGRESSTAGLRFFPVARTVFPRRPAAVDSPWGRLEVKIIEAGGRVRVHPEFESCRRLAEESGAPLREIMAWAAALDWRNE